MKLLFGASTVAIATFFVGCKDDGKCEIIAGVSNSTITCPDGHSCADSGITGIKYCKDDNAKACTGTITNPVAGECPDGSACFNKACVDTTCDPTCGTNEMCVAKQCVGMGTNDVTTCTEDKDCAANTVNKKCIEYQVTDNMKVKTCSVAL